MNLDFSGIRGATPDCPSERSLDALNMDALEAAERSELEAHTTSCEFCTARLAELRLGFDAFPQLDERRVLAQLQQAKPAKSRLWGLLGLLVPVGIAAAAVFMLLPVGPGPVDPVDPIGGVRIKGKATLRVFRHRDGKSEETRSGDAFAAGDRIKFVVDLPSAGALSVYGVDAKGALYTAWPMDAQPQSLALGKGQTLPGAAELDDSKGSEQLYLVHCPGSEAPPKCSKAAKGLSCPEGCTQSRFELRKP